MQQPSNHNTQNWILLFFLTLIWGTSYILIKKSLDGFTAFEVGALRISISCLVALPIAIYGLKKIPKQKYVYVLLIGIFGTGLPSILFPLSLLHSDSSVNGILNSLSPLWTLIIGYYLYQVAITPTKVAGILIGFSGALVLVLGKQSKLIQFDLVYCFLPILATFCYGMSANITKQKLQNQNPIYTTALAMNMIGIPALISLFFTDAPHKISSGLVWFPFMCVVLLALFATLVAWVLFYRLVQRTDALFASSVTYLVPIVAVGWGLYFHEVLSLLQVLGMLLILTGVYFTTYQKKSA